ncbi:MAG: ribosome biogenesis GTPase Der [Candidatus Zixiibacteriota bacterium]
MKTPLVALIGRPNVGKSSLFNRFLKRKLAIVDDRPGITRDRNYALCDWNRKEFYLIDTGGMIPGSTNAINKMVLEQSETAIEQADLIVLIVDNKTGPDHIDEQIARNLQKSKKNILLIANKADNDLDASEIYQFLNLGLGDPMPVSATGGLGIGEALDAIVERLPEPDEEQDRSESIRIAVIGRPNAGKSLFINRLIGEERVIVSDIPGTTRDSVDTPFVFEGRQYTLVDTAGLRRKARVKEDVEYYTTLRTIRAIEDCDVALVLIDSTQGMTFQDLKVIEDASTARRGIVLAINKWDLIEKDGKTADRFTAELKDQAKTYTYLPVIYISALTGQRVSKVISYIDNVYENWHRKVQTAELNIFLEEIYQKQLPAAVQGKYIKFFYCTQTEIKPPTFVFFCNYPHLIQKSYLRYIENRLREKYDFEGVPIRIKMKER